MFLSQESIKDSSINLPMAKISYALQFPGGNLSERFGINSNIGLDFCYKTKNNLVGGVLAGFIFGNNVKETSMLDGLKTEKGYIINAHGEAGYYAIFERGFHITAYGGYFLDLLGPNPNSGFMGKFGFGFLRHKIRIDDEKNDIPQLQDDYLKGYDRLTFGGHLYQYLGYQYLSNSRFLNFYGGIEFYEGFTQGRRDYQVDLTGPYHEKRFDFLFGVRVGWILPLYKRAPREYYYD